jgi:hypothetical protein
VATDGRVVFASGSPSQLRQPFAVAVTVRDDQGECDLIKRELVAKLSKAFPSWRLVAEDQKADLKIVYGSGFSLCFDNCDPQPLPQGANVELVLGAGSVRAHWSDDSHWRSRGRLVTLFVAALVKVVHGGAA